MDRWATFDCYGTLIDWNGGIRAELGGCSARADDRRRGGASADADELLARYHELERELEHDGTLSYREVMTEAMRRLGAPEGEESGPRRLAPALAAVPRGRRRARPSSASAGWKTRDPLELRPRPDRRVEGAARRPASTRRSSPRRSTPTSRRSLHWIEFYARTLADRRRHVHVAASLYHDIAPAARLRLPNVWINRLGEHPGTRPDDRAARPRRARPTRSTSCIPAGSARCRQPRVQPGSAGRGLRSRCAMSETRIDVKVEQVESAPAESTHPNTCPRLRVALPRRRARGGALRLRRSAATTSGCRPAPGSRGSPTPARSSRRRPRSARPTRSTFFDLRPYRERLAEAELNTGLTDAIVVGAATLDGQPLELAVMDFAFMGGSMGSAVGEKFVRACDAAIAARDARCCSSRARAARGCRRGSSR